MPEIVSSFDDLLDAAARRGPHKLEVKALGGKAVYVRDPSSEDVDLWRMWVRQSELKGLARPLVARLVQIMLCDEKGDRVVPQTDEALQQLAESNQRAIDEISVFCMKLVQDPSEEDLESEKKD